MSVNSSLRFFSISVPSEISAAQVLLTFWDSNPNHTGAYIVSIQTAPDQSRLTLTIFQAAIVVCGCAVNVFGVR